MSAGTRGRTSVPAAITPENVNNAGISLDTAVTA